MLETLKRLRINLRPIYGERETEAIIRLIFHYVKGWSQVDMIMHEADSLSPFIRSEIDDILSRLKKHEPIQYITGEARFHGMDFMVTPDVLIPRPETDELVDIICSYAGDVSDLRVLDIATGSGCIAISLARSLRFPHVEAIDISEAALKVAQGNATRLKTHVTFIHDDIFRWTATPSSFDIIVSNPPYIDESERPTMDPNVTEYEPASALFVPDNDPLIFYKCISDIAFTALSNNGILYLEINPRHAFGIRNILSDKGFSDIRIEKDSSGRDRFAIAGR